ncbi:hypothetical protein COHA_002608 [Chlorella ohadii]|uniref:Uncharacterized protein n=1 Tax=Chlorella ohadii TaxID=2649997 RepID=A0AAD5H477_9CHLO|nr:hypothetical protein COHA_002608 [Chlorella ohadii]
MVGVLPKGACLAADLPHCGPLSYLICLIRALFELRSEVRSAGVHSKVPGLVELHDPAQRRLSFLLPLEGRSDMLPF